MMEAFYAVLKASFQGSIVILAVILLRQLLKKAPRSVFCLLWLLAGLRLLLPFEIESRLSLQPKMDEPEVNIQMEAPVQVPDFVVPEMGADVPEAVPADPEEYENWESESFLHQENDGVVSPITFGDVAARIWLLGMGIMLAASAVSYWKLKRRVREAYLIENGCFECPGLDTAFVLGFLPPRIYLPMGLTDQEKKFIFDHENTHIARYDHWYKLLGYLVLSMHWFNPLVWIGYGLLCRDIELACDEHVIRYMSLPERKAYSAALLSCGSHTARIAACPVAFGESNPKKRILNVLNYKRPTFWISLTAVVAVIFVAVCLMTSPAEDPQQADDTLTWNLEMTVSDVSPAGLTVEFIQHGPFQGYDRAELQFGSDYSLEKWVNGNWEPVEMLPQEYAIAWTTEAYLINRDSTTTQRIDWVWLYGELPTGRYRIGKGVDLFRGTGDWDSQMFYAEFEISKESAPQASGEGEAYIALCREAMMNLKNSEELYLYISNLDDPMATTNVYMHASNGWLFKYRRPGWDCEEVQWLRLGNAQYIYGGDMDDNGVMTTPYYWQVEQNPDSHDYQLPYPFDLDWESIGLNCDGVVTEDGYEVVTIGFPLYLDVFTFCFDDTGELMYFDVGDSTGEPEATTSRYYVRFPHDGTVEDYLETLYSEATAEAGQKPGVPDDAYYEELFSRKTDGHYTEQWIYDLFKAFYACPEEFVHHLAGRDRTEEIITHMGYDLDFYAPYLFASILTSLREDPNADETILELLEACLTGDSQAEDYLEKCRTALDNYQSQGAWVILVENTFTGDGAMNPYSTALWHINGEEWYKQAITGSADFTTEHCYLKTAGKTFCRESHTIHNPANGEGYSAGWTKDSQYADMPLPWPLTFKWDESGPEYVQADHWDRGEKITFAVQGSLYAGEHRGSDSYQVTFWLTEKGELWSIDITYTEKDGMGETTNVRSVITPNAAAPEEAPKMIELKRREAVNQCVGTTCTDPGCTDASHDHSGIYCMDQACTNAAHDHSERDCADTNCSDTSHHHDHDHH